MEDRIEKELKDLNFDLVDFDSGAWSWGKGGRPLEDNEFSITHTAEDLTETRYRLPKCLNEMMLRHYEWGAEEARYKIRRALGV